MFLSIAKISGQVKQGESVKKKNNVYLQFGESAKTRKRRIGELRDHVVTQISEMDNMQLGINKTNKSYSTIWQSKVSEE